MGSRRKARECALQMLFAADVAEMPPDDVVRSYWAELGESDLDETARGFATRLARGTLSNLELLDDRIRSRAEHWRISRMAVVDRNILRLAVYELTLDTTPPTVALTPARAASARRRPHRTSPVRHRLPVRAPPPNGRHKRGAGDCPPLLDLRSNAVHQRHP